MKAGIIAQKVFRIFASKKEKSLFEKFDFSKEGFTEDQKKEIVNMGLSTASQVLISSCVMANAHNFIEGDVLFPDGSKWVLKFERFREEAKLKEIERIAKIIVDCAAHLRSVDATPALAHIQAAFEEAVPILKTPAK